MSNRYFDQLPPWVTFTQTWGNKVGIGRWHKKMLHKARRRFGRQLCRDGERAYRHAGGLVDWESWCNWKGW